MPTVTAQLRVDPQLALPELVRELAVDSLEEHFPAAVADATRIQPLRLELMPDGETVLVHVEACPNVGRSAVRTADVLTAVVAHYERSARCCTCVPGYVALNTWRSANLIQLRLLAATVLPQARDLLARGELPENLLQLVTLIDEVRTLRPLREVVAEVEALLQSRIQQLTPRQLGWLVTQLRGHEHSADLLLQRALEHPTPPAGDDVIVLTWWRAYSGDRLGLDLVRRWAGGHTWRMQEGLAWLPLGLAVELYANRPLAWAFLPAPVDEHLRAELQLLTASLVEADAEAGRVAGPSEKVLQAALSTALDALSA